MAYWSSYFSYYHFEDFWYHLNSLGSERKSIWMDEVLPSFAPLQENLSTDICIVGAGIAGLTIGYTLANEGKSVVIIDQSSVGKGETSRTTAHLSWILNDRYFELEKYFGLTGAQLAAGSHASAIDYIETIIQTEEINCDFERVDGYLFPGSNDSIETIHKEFEAIKRIGKEVDKVSIAPFSSFFDSGTSLLFHRQGQFHILKYLKGLIEAFLKKGGKIYENTHASEIKEGKVKTKPGYVIEAQSIVVATATPVNDRVIIHTKQSPYRTYVIASLIPKNSVPKGLYWDTEDPYHYIRTHPFDHTSDWLIIGGKDHKVGQEENTDSHFDQLEKWSRKRFHFDRILKKWSGQVFDSIDALGYIGKNPLDDNVYIATGDTGNGMTHGTIAGILIPDLILGKNNPWKDLYDPSRKNFTCADEYVKENLNTLAQYRDWLTPGECKKIQEIPIDSGFILRKGLKKLAIYKDLQGEIQICSAFCPHLGGCVRWNPTEKSWDCPCHGSRFDCSGKVISGPAISDLKTIL